MAAKIIPGTYEARVSDYGIGTAQDGAAQVLVLFNYRDADNEEHEITWFGSMNEGKARAITLKALLTCGFAGDDVAALAEGVHANLLDTVAPVSIVIEENEWQGKKSMRVKWVNQIGGFLDSKRIEKSQAKVLLGTMNLKGELAMLRQAQGVKKTPPPRTSGHPFAPESDVDTGNDESPFGL